MKYKITKLFQKHNVTGIAFNSKKIKKGDAFFAIRGSNSDGNKYIDDVLKIGASLVFSDDNKFKNNRNSLIVHVEDVRAALTIAAEYFYPKTPENLIAVTGTNGKTSVVSYCQQLFELLGSESASLGTIGLVCSKKAITEEFDKEQYKALTSTDILTFRQILNHLAENNINNLAFEASSHGLDQQRMGNLAVNAAAFTNFSQDHLDYHGTMDNYLKAKLKLFSNNLRSDGLAVISSEIAEIDLIKEFLGKNNLNYLTVGESGEIKVCAIIPSMSGQDVSFSYQGKKYNFNTEIIGSFQASNLLIAAALVHRFGFPFNEIVKKISQVKAVKGRLDRVTNPSDLFQVFVDYSHTPESLQKALIELRKIITPEGRLIVIFGCGGDRDVSKRPLMGKIAEDYADIQIVTDDNPRFENPHIIREQILKAVPNAREIGDRILAVNTAVNLLKGGDILLIAGKGHEDYQIIGDRKIPMDDFEIAKDALKGKL